MKKVLIFGSTGSIGRNALRVIRQSKGKFKVIGLSANRDIKTLFTQIKEFRPAYVCVRDEAAAKELKAGLRTPLKLFSGDKGMEEFSSLRSDIALMAISGVVCLKPLLTAISASRRIALANKESIVTAGPLVFKKARIFNTQILPVDSEINALFQLIEDKGAGAPRRVYLTASGGPLAGYSKKKLTAVGVKKVLAHPTWKMGQRVTVDSATLVNKGFEVVETHNFFGLPYEKISVLLHKESSVHALLLREDNTIFACLYPPDMKTPIAYALYYPQKAHSVGELPFRSNFSYSFAPLKCKDYPCFEIILEAAKRGDNSLVVLNAGDEVAIDYFLKKKIKFIDIRKVLAYLLRSYKAGRIDRIEDVFFWDSWARAKTREYLKRL